MAAHLPMILAAWVRSQSRSACRARRQQRGSSRCCASRWVAHTAAGAQVVAATGDSINRPFPEGKDRIPRGIRRHRPGVFWSPSGRRQMRSLPMACWWSGSEYPGAADSVSGPVWGPQTGVMRRRCDRNPRAGPQHCERGDACHAPGDQVAGRMASWVQRLRLPPALQPGPPASFR